MRFSGLGDGYERGELLGKARMGRVRCKSRVMSRMGWTSIVMGCLFPMAHWSNVVE